MIKAVCPGSFDPITNGHLDIIERAAALFDEVTVVVMTNYSKQGLYFFSAKERAALIRKAVAHLENVTVDSYNGLLADYCRDNDIRVVVKGLRNVSDYDSECRQAQVNGCLNPGLETVFMSARAENLSVSSGMVRQIGELGGDISGFVPASVYEDIKEHLRRD